VSESMSGGTPGLITAASKGAPSLRAARGGIQSVDRALMLLELIADSGGQAALTELAERAGLNISTCHHLLATLIQRGFVTKIQGRRYALGARILSLGHACLQVDLPRRAERFIDAINQTTGEAVHLAVRQGDSIVTLVRRDSRHAVRVDIAALGRSDAAHATACGKSILAWLPEEQIRRILALHGMHRFTPNTIVDFAPLIEELRLVRRNGFAIDREEFHPGVICIGAAIRDYTGAVVGAISVSTPTMRGTDDHLLRMREDVVAACNALSGELGESGSLLPLGAPIPHPHVA
jgi:IclR family transcriptional regulator, acetate operon repressor